MSRLTAFIGYAAASTLFSFMMISVAAFLSILGD